MCTRYHSNGNQVIFTAYDAVMAKAKAFQCVLAMLSMSPDHRRTSAC